MELTGTDFSFIGICLEGFLYGLYSGIFVLYLQHHSSKRGTHSDSKILLYALCALYVLSLVSLVIDLINFMIAFLSPAPTGILLPYYLVVMAITITGFCDFVSQSVLVYRCWIVWGRKIRVVIIPAIVTVAFLGIWAAAAGACFIIQDQLLTANWGNLLTLIGLAMSMSVNALVTALIVIRIFMVFRQVKPTSDEKTLGASGGAKLRSIIFLLIESGMALFSIQLARLALVIEASDVTFLAYKLIVPIHQMLNGITPTIILVRVSMGLSFHDEESMEEVAESLRFASGPPTTFSESGSIGIVDQERIYEDVGDSDIQMLER